MNFLYKPIATLLLTGLLSGFGIQANAQSLQEAEPFVFDNDNSVYVQEFNEYAGTEESLPSAMFVSWDMDRLDNPFNGIGNFFNSDPETAYGNFVAYTSDNESFSFGIRERAPGDLRNARLFFAFTNNTDEPISAFEVSYDVEAWYVGNRRNRIRMKFDNLLESDDRDTFGVDLVSTDNPSATETPDTKVDGSLEENRVRIEELIDITLVDNGTGVNFEAVQPGETAYFRFQFSNTDGDGGSLRSGLAINNLEIRLFEEEVPEPVQSKFSFTNENDTFMEDFNDYRGTEESLNEFFFVSWDEDRLVNPFNGVGDFNTTDPDEAYGNFAAYTSDDEEFSFGIRERAPLDLRNARLFFAFTNDTDQPVSVFNVNYDVEAWYIGDRRNRLRLKFDTELNSETRDTFEEDIFSTDNPSSETTAGVKVNGAMEDNRTSVGGMVDITTLVKDDETGETFEPLMPGESAYFRFQFSNTDGDGGSRRSGLAVNNFEVSVVTGTSVQEPGERPVSVELAQNYPNPFNPTTQISYTLSEASDVQLDVYTIAGQRVATLVNSGQQTGNHTVSFDGSAMASGIYIYRLQANNQVLTRKMTLIK